MRTPPASCGTLTPYVETTPQPQNQEGTRDLARTLKGVLPCARCGYELKGLSIRSACPECGLGVRATLLAAVDPAAEELKPLRFPKLLIAGLMAWSIGALVAGVMMLAIRVLNLANVDLTGWYGRLAGIAIAGIGISWLGSCVLIRPHSETPPRNIIRALISVIAYAVVAFATAYLLLSFDPKLSDAPYTRPGVIVADRHEVRLAIGAAMLLIIVLLRPNARMLAARSLVLRNGRVDRQPLYALAAAVGVAMCGDLLLLVTSRLPGMSTDITWGAGALLIAVGSLLLLIGMVGIVLDCYRVSRVLIEPAPSMRDIIGAPDEDDL